MVMCIHDDPGASTVECIIEAIAGPDQQIPTVPLVFNGVMQFPFEGTQYSSIDDVVADLKTNGVEEDVTLFNRTPAVGDVYNTLIQLVDTDDSDKVKTTCMITVKVNNVHTDQEGT